MFKDGHAVLLHQGILPLDSADGSVTLDSLPAPVLGTFWPFAADKSVRLRSVVAGRKRAPVERTAVSLRELLAANVGKSVVITEAPVGAYNSGQQGKVYEATIVALPARTPEEVEAARDPRNNPPNYSGNTGGYNTGYDGSLGGGGFGGGGFGYDNNRAGLVLLRTAEGVRAVDVARILDVTFKDAAPAQKLATSEWRARLTMYLDGAGNGAPRPANAAVGLLYLQKGLRWIPSYKVTLGQNSSAAVSLQATLINEITDLNNVTASLVIGVPTFVFQDTPDPSGLVDVIGRLGPFFDAASRSALNNAIAGQGGWGGFGGGGVSVGGGFGLGQRGGRASGEGDGQSALAADVADAGRSEDLFVFSVKNVTLGRGQRATLPVASYTLPYRDVYTLDLPLGAELPALAAGLTPGQEEQETARQSRAPRPVHRIRLVNNGPHPLTTAPVLLVEPANAATGGSTGAERVLAQNLLRYTPVGTETDLTLTTAGDLTYQVQEREAKRVPAVFALADNTVYDRIEYVGTLRVSNRTGGPIVLEATRSVLGGIDSVGQNGARARVDAQGRAGAPGDGAPPPALTPATPGRAPTYDHSQGSAYIARVNGASRVFWRRALATNETVDLTYTWHTFARR